MSEVPKDYCKDCPEQVSWPNCDPHAAPCPYHDPFDCNFCEDRARELEEDEDAYDESEI